MDGAIMMAQLGNLKYKKGRFLFGNWKWSTVRLPHMFEVSALEANIAVNFDLFDFDYKYERDRSFDGRPLFGIILGSDEESSRY
jgi:hypothetical protein